VRLVAHNKIFAVFVAMNLTLGLISIYIYIHISNVCIHVRTYMHMYVGLSPYESIRLNCNVIQRSLWHEFVREFTVPSHSISRAPASSK
jgi:hypothetical protein